MPAVKKRNPQPVAKLLSPAALGQAAECLKTLAHPHRLRMVQMLLRGRFTVGELAEQRNASVGGIGAKPGQLPIADRLERDADEPHDCAEAIEPSKT